MLSYAPPPCSHQMMQRRRRHLHSSVRLETTAGPWSPEASDLNSVASVLPEGCSQANAAQSVTFYEVPDFSDRARLELQRRLARRQGSIWGDSDTHGHEHTWDRNELSGHPSSCWHGCTESDADVLRRKEAVRKFDTRHTSASMLTGWRVHPRRCACLAASDHKQHTCCFLTCAPHHFDGLRIRLIWLRRVGHRETFRAVVLWPIEDATFGIWVHHAH